MTLFWVRSFWRDLHSVFPLQIWDIDVSTGFNGMNRKFYREGDGFLLVYDVNQAETLDYLVQMIEQVAEILSIDRHAIPLVLVGNKCDMENRQVTY